MDAGKPRPAEVAVPLQRLVRDFMTRKVRFVRPRTPLREVVALMQQLRVRHMPVVDERRRLRGLITHRDVITAHFMLTAAESGQERNAGQLMTTELDTVEALSCLHCAAVLMFERKRGCLPVVDKQGHLVGILTESDFVRAFRDAEPCMHVSPPPAK
jgi:CBS domain-containing protein